MLYELLIKLIKLPFKIVWNIVISFLAIGFTIGLNVAIFTFLTPIGWVLIAIFAGGWLLMPMVIFQYLTELWADSEA